jgi:hypothetical protein
LYVLKRGSCPSHVPVPCDAVVYEEYPPGEGIEVSRQVSLREYGLNDGSAQAWHKATGTWVD